MCFDIQYFKQAFINDFMKICTLFKKLWFVEDNFTRSRSKNVLSLIWLSIHKKDQIVILFG